jgi:DNA-directed RNA polymerase specialized sigma24 family protein
VVTLRRQPPPIHLLNQILSNREMEILLLVLRYGCTVEDAAARLAIPAEHAKQLLHQALRTVRRYGNRCIDPIKRRPTVAAVSSSKTSC